MKYYKRLGLYKASNVWFDPKDVEAYSYDWWCFVRKIGKQVVFNDFPYSTSTRRHQWKIQHLMRELGITIDCVIESPQGLFNLESAVAHYKLKIKQLESDIDNPKASNNVNVKRLYELERLNDRLETVLALKEVA